MPLLLSRRLAPLLLTQTMGAVNDNLFKNALVVLVLFHAAGSSGPALVALAGGVFILPYALLSATAGQVADRFEKSRTIVAVKAAEVALMAVGAAGLLLDSTPLLFAVLFGLGIQATFFGPLKYSILPALVGEGELVAANGLVEAGTFLGILAGTIAGSALIGLEGGRWIVSLLGLGLAGLGVVSAWWVPRAEPQAAAVRIGWNVVAETAALLAGARANAVVWRCVWGISGFWVAGATLVAVLPTVVRDELHATEGVFTLMLACFSVGIGAGSVLCSRLLRGAASARLAPVAAVGLAVFLADFAWAAWHAGAVADLRSMLAGVAGWRMMADLVLLAACGGVYSVPLYAILQGASPPSHQARMVASNNVVNAVGIVVAAGLVAVLASVGVGPVPVLLLTAAGAAGAAAWVRRAFR